MAWGEKYTHTYCNRYGKSCKVAILEEDYAGTSTEVKAGPSPIVYNIESTSDLKFDPLRAKSATVTLIGSEAFDMEFLWTADERKYMVESWINGSLDFRGFVIPNGFSYDFTGGLYYATITASDGLSTLKGIKFLSESGEPYNLVDLTFNDGPRYPFILIATEILKKLDLSLNLWVCADFYEQRMSKTGGREGDPLANSTVDVRTYINDSQRDDIPYWQDIGGVFDCERVLRNLCTIWGARIYQQGGVWRLKSINADTSDTPTRVWRKYNTAAVYIGQENIADNIMGACSTDDLKLINASHSMAMDRVFGQVAVNYKYTFIREGDTPVNLILNGNLVWATGFGNAPLNWKANNNIELTKETASPPCAPTGICTAVTVIGNPNEDVPTIDAAMESAHIDVSQGDNIMMTWWQRTPPIDTSVLGDVLGAGTYAIACRLNPNDPNSYYWLVNDGVSGSKTKTRWVKSGSVLYLAVTPLGLTHEQLVANDYWSKVDLEVPALPSSGQMYIKVHGLASRYLKYTDFMFGAIPRPERITFTIYDWVPNSNPLVRGPVPSYGVDSQHGSLAVTGFFAGLIKNVSSEEVPKIHRYLYPETPRSNYTDRPDPVEVLNGDAVDSDHVSAIQVEGVSGKLFWDTIDQKFGYSSIGLVLARSIAEQYCLPNRILEGDFQAENMHFGSRIELEYLPGVRFIMQRGTYDVKSCWWLGTTLIQISNQEIPEGGSDDGNTVNPIWQDTGNTRCVKEEGVNTGAVEKQQQDINPASNTFGDLRWVDAGTDTTTCPIGEPDAYLWGAEPATYDPDNFVSNPIALVEGNGILVNFNNDGGKYLYFLHLSTKGIVTSILDQRGAETISDWQYLSDDTINGYTYKVLRMNYVTAIYTGVPMTFIFTT